jgi:hypothetical protein
VKQPWYSALTFAASLHLALLVSINSRMGSSHVPIVPASPVPEQPFEVSILEPENRLSSRVVSPDPAPLDLSNRPPQPEQPADLPSPHKATNRNHSTPSTTNDVREPSTVGKNQILQGFSALTRPASGPKSGWQVRTSDGGPQGTRPKTGTPGGLGRGAPFRPQGPNIVDRLLRDGMKASDHRLGLGQAGVAIAAIRTAMTGPHAPQRGNASVAVTTDSSGKIIAVSLLHTQPASSEWQHVLAEMKARLLGRKLRVPSKSRGLYMVLAINAEIRRPSGTPAGKFPVQMAGPGVKFDLADLSGKVMRVVNVRAVVERDL